MQLTAAELQKRHELEGAPDPFPSLGETTAVKPRRAVQVPADADSQADFPTLATSTPVAATPGKSAWGSDAGPRIKATVKSTPVITDYLTVTQVETPVKDGRQTSLGEIMKQVMIKYRVKIEASTNQSRQTTFHLKGETQKDLDKAKRHLLATLSPVVTLILNAPASTIAALIGPKGATLKKVREATGVKVDIPPKDGAPNGQASGTNGTSTPLPGDEEEEVMVPVTITGSRPLALEAQAMLNEIITSRTSQLTQKIRDIPAHILPFVLNRRNHFIEVAQESYVNLALNQAEREITVSGDREGVVRVVETIKATVEAFRTSLTSLKISLPKRQHRLLAGKAVDEILVESKCLVEVASPEDLGDDVTVWGLADNLPTGLGAVMAKANSQFIHEFPLPGPLAVSKQILTYMTRIDYEGTLASAHPDALIFTPSPAAIAQASVLNIDIAGEKSVVDAVVRQISELIGKLIGATREVSVEWLVHRIVQGKNAKKLKQFHEAHNVQVFFPPESAEQSQVLLVYDPLSPSASPSPVEKEKHLNIVVEELLTMVKEAGEVKSQLVPVEKRWHEAVVGQEGTTLNAIIGEDTTLSIKVGAQAGDASDEDVILVRGAIIDVDRAVKEILQVVEDAKNDAIVSSYSIEFDIDREYVGRVVGAQGSGVNRLRDALGVKVDFSDEADEKEKDAGKKKKAAVTHQKSKVKITGRKENVEEAKKRILSQVERLADETSEVLKIPNQYHAQLIGQSGKYAIRLEENYGVKITFPRSSGENGEGKTREQLKPDEVLIKGGKRGVASAKSELLEALEFEKENNKVLTFDVPSRSVSRILGKGGASIHEIKDDTGAQIDVDKTGDGSSSVTQITVRGTKEAINAAKSAILAIADQVGEEITASLVIEPKFHRTIIGAGGQGLKDLINRCGGPSDPKLQAGLVRFPRQGESSDDVRLRGEPKLVNKVKEELEKIVATLRDRVVLAVEIPASQHRNLIGRGGQHLNDLQNRTGVQVQFPGSRSYNQFGDPENASEMADADPANIVKVSGPRKACEAAVEELKTHVKPAAPEGVTAIVSVPLKYHHVISQQGQFFRTLRNFGVSVEQSGKPQKPAVPTAPPQNGSTTARIDDAEDVPSIEIDWQVAENYLDAEEGDSEWTLKGSDAAGLERAQSLIQDAIAQAAAMTCVGFLSLPDRSAFPRIVGSKGSNVTRLRNETGADITVGRENSTIIIIGSESAVDAAKEAILKQISMSGRHARH
ncbi:hypothetical protein DEU56DRAFT_33581 [Suillus clintonianus]|uniref:uncharacterized protein n=1 Tax=Suillus clintonianus TaxID=1904413 RepID=UPI001B87D092|nr:uncharacterized protein DEU56DRAFT_33581 [Suillus clintonianus]KAG2150530.1 hypothetical protein DEU56DRAFT_33581 [Suillus clintonianus]